MTCVPTPEVIHPIPNHPLRLLEKDGQVEVVPLVLSLTQEAITVSKVVQNLFMILTSNKQLERI